MNVARHPHCSTSTRWSRCSHPTETKQLLPILSIHVHWTAAGSELIKLLFFRKLDALRKGKNEEPRKGQFWCVLQGGERREATWATHYPPGSLGVQDEDRPRPGIVARAA
jgi:hypothetical protein